MVMKANSPLVEPPLISTRLAFLCLESDQDGDKIHDKSFKFGALLCHVID